MKNIRTQNTLSGLKYLCPITLLIGGAASMIYSAQAQATIVNLMVYENASGVDTSKVNVWVDVIDKGSGAEFTFHNDSENGFISNIYFEKTEFSDNALTNAVIVTPEFSDVDFSKGSSPKNPAGSIKNFGGVWDGNLFSAKADSPAPKNGIKPGEYLTIRFDYNDIDFDDLITGLSDPLKFRMAQHIQGLSKCDASIWTVNTPVPLPSTLVLLAAGLPLFLRRKML